MKWLGAIEDTPVDWGTITVQARELLSELPVTDLYPAMSVQHSVSGQRYKFRRYATEQEAANITLILQSLPCSLAMTPLLGIDRSLLCFGYVEAEPMSLEGAHFRKLGRWLGKLAAETQDWIPANEIEETYQSWLNDLETRHFFSSAVMQRARDFYNTLRPDRLSGCVNYWDAMPPNFGLHGGQLLMLDEKHLRPGVVGAGLVKPRMFLPPQAFSALLEGYAAVAPLDDILEQTAFLNYYYRTYALWFYVRGLEIDPTGFDCNPRFRRFRAAFLSSLEMSAVGNRREHFHFVLHYPGSNARYFWKRVKRWWRRSFIGKS